MKKVPVVEGVGLGLRSCHYQKIINDLPAVPWFEALTDNYLGPKAKAVDGLLQVRQHYPLTLHGVGLSLASMEPLSVNYLALLRQLVDIVSPAWVSDHLSWSHSNKHYVPDLLPVPYCPEFINFIADKIKQVQDLLGCSFLLENVSSYMQFAESSMPEWEFFTLVVERADCKMLLDINNIYVNAKNHGFDPYYFIAQIPKERVYEYHLAGFSLKGDILFDTHSKPVHEPVWELYKYALQKIGPKATLIEWDKDIPSFEILQQEATKANLYYEQAQHCMVD